MNPDQNDNYHHNNNHHYHQQQPPQQQQKSAKIFNNQWILKKKVSSGSFGVVFIAVDKNTKQQVAIKLEKEDSEEIRSLEREVQILSRLQGLSNVPKLFYSGQENNYNILVIQLLGPDLAHYMKNHKKLSLKTVLCLADQLIPILESVHNRSVIHRDLKPENILMGLNDTDTEGKVFLIDYGISKIYRDSNGRHISFKEDKPFIGTTRYASVAAHLGHELGRKDDLESLIYVLLFLIKGNLPWQNLQNVPDGDKTTVVGEIKQKTAPAELCKDLPEEFKKYLEYVKKLHFKSTPDYKYLKQLFQKLGRSQGINYSNQSFEYDWTLIERKKKQEQEEEKQRIQQLKQQHLEQQKQLELQRQQEQQKQMELQKQQEQAAKQQQLIQSANVNPNGLKHKEFQKKQSLTTSNNLVQWHRTSSLQAQEQKNNALLQPPNAAGASNFSNSPHNLLQQNSKDSFIGGSNLSNSFIGNNSSVYMQYQAKHQKGGLEASNMNFDDIDQEAEKVIRGSNLNLDEDIFNLNNNEHNNNQNNKRNGKGKGKDAFSDDEEVAQEKVTQINSSKDLFTVGTVAHSSIEEFSDKKSTVSQKYKDLQNGYSNLKILKQKTQQKSK